MLGLFRSVATRYRVLFKIRPLILKFYDNRVLKDREIEFLVQKEIIFQNYIRDVGKIYGLVRRSEDRINSVTGKHGNSLSEFNKVIIELMFLLFFLDGKCVDNDTELSEEEKESFGWLHALWMVFQAKKYIPDHLNNILGHLPKEYKNPDLKNKPLYDIHEFLMKLYVERRDKVFNRFNSSDNDRAINDGIGITFFHALTSSFSCPVEAAFEFKILNDTYEVIIANYQRVYGAINNSVKN
jgi:hypothetical protein